MDCDDCYRACDRNQPKTAVKSYYKKLSIILYIEACKIYDVTLH